MLGACALTLESSAKKTIATRTNRETLIVVLVGVHVGVGALLPFSAQPTALKANCRKNQAQQPLQLIILIVKRSGVHIGFLEAA